MSSVLISVLYVVVLDIQRMRFTYLDSWDTVAKRLFLEAKPRSRIVKAGRLKPLDLQAFFITVVLKGDNPPAVI